VIVTATITEQLSRRDIPVYRFFKEEVSGKRAFILIHCLEDQTRSVYSRTLDFDIERYTREQEAALLSYNKVSTFGGV
jgi:hypothetical protein